MMCIWLLLCSSVWLLQYASAQQTIAVRSATWSADDGDANRDSGPMDDVFATCNGGDQYVRYRTGGSASFTTLLTLDQPSDVAGISITVRQSPDTDGEGYSGIEISVSSGGGFREVYNRHEMFGEFERGATHETIAADFVLGSPTVFAFPSVASGVTQIRVRMFYADINGDASISFNSITVDSSSLVATVPPPPPPPPAPSYQPSSAGLAVRSATWSADDGD
eukprot:COSAG02_NODE_14832_length_1232_cov_0.756399_2_plen_221_part_01